MTDPGSDPDPTQAMPAMGGDEPPGPTDPLPPDEPPAEPPAEGGDRRRWIILAVLAAVVAVVLLIALLGGDDGDDDRASTTTTSTSTTSTSTTTASTTTTTAPTTTTTAASTTTTAATGTTIDPARCVSSAADDPAPTAQVVHDAWVVGDQACAGNLMTSEALADLFSRPGAGSTEQFSGCNEDEDAAEQMICSWYYEGGATNYRMAYSEVEGWTVFEVFQVAD